MWSWRAAGVLIVFGWAAAAWGAPPTPATIAAGSDRAIEVVFDPPPGPRCVVRLPGFEQLRLIVIPERLQGVCDAEGRATKHAVALAAAGRKATELWFEAERGGRYFVCWSDAPGMTRKAPAKAAKKAAPPADGTSLRERLAAAGGEPLDGDRPASFAAGLPIVAGRAGSLYRTADVAGKPQGKGKGKQQEAAPREATAVAGGFLRICGVEEAAALEATIEFSYHRDPWRTKVPPLTIEPAAAGSPWFYAPGIRDLAPFTISILRADGSGRVEFSAGLDQPAFRTIPFGPEGLVVECGRTDFATATDVRTDAEVSGETLAQVQGMTFRGRPPRRFLVGSPRGHRHDYEAGRLLGFNCLFGSPASILPEHFSDHGYVKAVTYTKVMSLKAKGYGYDLETNDADIAADAALLRERGILDRIHAVSLYDEPGLDVTKILRGEPNRMPDVPASRAIIAAAGLSPTAFADPDAPPPPGTTPADDAFWKHVRTARLDERDRRPQFVLDTMRFQAGIYASRFGLIRDALRRHYGPQILATANVHDSQFMRGLPTDIEPWRLYGPGAVLDVPAACDYGVAHGPIMEFMIDLFRAAQQPHEHPIQAFQASQSHYLPRSPRSLLLRTMSAVGAGARSIYFYAWGPRYAATENWFSDEPERLRTMGEIAHAVGWAEDALLEGRPRPARIAILWPRDGDLWDQLDGLGFYGQERRFCYLLLRGMQHRADLLSDAALPPDDVLDRHAVIFMSQRCIPDAAADRLLAWVERGGTLVASLACGQLDGLARPSRRMLDAFGISDLAIDGADMSRRGIDGIPAREIAGTGVTTRGVTAAVKPQGAEVKATFADGGPAVLERRLGKGRLVATAFLLGHAHVKGTQMEADCPVGQQVAVDGIVAPWLAAAGRPDCAADVRGVSARLIEGPTASAVVLVNSTGREAVEAVTVSIARQPGTPLAAKPPRSVASLAHGTLEATVTADEIRVGLPLGLTDVLLIE